MELYILSSLSNIKRAMPNRQKLDINFLINHTEKRTGGSSSSQPHSTTSSSSGNRRAPAVSTPSTQGEETFVCDQCGLAFKWKGNLKKHVLSVHLKQRSHPCKHCGKTFSFRDGLTRHIAQVHLDVRRFKCEICSAAFKQQTHLQTHLRTIHGAKK